MSPAGAGNRPADMQALCPSSVPVKLGDTWLDKMGVDKLLGTPKEMTIAEIDDAVASWVHGAVVANKAGFAGCQLHGAHGFLLSQFLSPYTNRRTDDYGGSPEKRMKLLRRLVEEIRQKCPPPYCLSVKLNSADYMEQGGLGQTEALEQVEWLVESGMVDFVEISGGNAEQKTSGLHSSPTPHCVSKAQTDIQQILSLSERSTKHLCALRPVFGRLISPISRTRSKPSTPIYQYSSREDFVRVPAWLMPLLQESVNWWVLVEVQSLNQSFRQRSY